MTVFFWNIMEASWEDHRIMGCHGIKLSVSLLEMRGNRWDVAVESWYKYCTIGNF